MVFKEELIRSSIVPLAAYLASTVSFNLEGPDAAMLFDNKN